MTVNLSTGICSPEQDFNVRSDAPNCSPHYVNVLRGITFIAAIMVVSNARAYDWTEKSANAMMPACRAIIQSSPNLTGKAPFEVANCAGLVEGLAFGLLWSGSICPDPRVTTEQIVRMVIQYIDKQQPVRARQSFKYLAAEAIKKAFPCESK